MTKILSCWCQDWLNYFSSWGSFLPFLCFLLLVFDLIILILLIFILLAQFKMSKRNKSDRGTEEEIIQPDGNAQDWGGSKQEKLFSVMKGKQDDGENFWNLERRRKVIKLTHRDNYYKHCHIFSGFFLGIFNKIGMMVHISFYNLPFHFFHLYHFSILLFKVTFSQVFASLHIKTSFTGHFNHVFS